MPTTRVTEHVALDDDYLLAAIVRPDGSEETWVLSVRDPDGTHGCACPTCAPLEQLTEARAL